MNKRSIYTIILLVLPTVVIAVTALTLMNWRIPTRVNVDLTVNRAVFTMGGEDKSLILNSVRFQSITIERFDNIELEPKKLEIADPVKYMLKEDRYSENAWKILPNNSPIVIRGAHERLQPAVTLENTKQGENRNGILDGVWIRPGTEVTIELRNTRNTRTSELTVKLDRNESFADLSFNQPFEVTTNNCNVSGLSDLPYLSDSLSYRVELPNHSSIVNIKGKSNSLVLILTISTKKMADLFPEGVIPVKTIDFRREDLKPGKILSSLVSGKHGEITYPDYLKIEKVIFEHPDFIGLDFLDKFYIKKITLDSEHKGIRFHMSGIAAHLRTGSLEFPKDHRLTLFDTLWQDPQLIILFSIVVWVFPTTVGGYLLFKEVKS